MDEYYVYIVYRANGNPCYIGKGKGNRCFDHLRKSHNKMLAGIAKKEGGFLMIEKIKEGMKESDAFALERELIAKYGRADRGGILVNLTDGGDGVVGRVWTDAQREARSKSQKGKSHLSPEARAKISAALKGRPKSPEHCAAVSAAKKGVGLGPMSKQHRDAIGNAHKGRKRSKEEMEAVMRGRSQITAEQRKLKSQRISEALTGKKLTDEHRLSISRAQRNLSPEAAASKRAKLKAALTGRKIPAEVLAKRRKRA